MNDNMMGGANDGWDLNFHGQTLDDVDKSGGNPPDGYYRVKVTEVALDQEDGAMVFKFKICHGVQTNRNVKAKLKNPQYAETPEKAATTQNRAKIFGVRLGLVPKEAEGRAANVDFRRAVGVECVISLKSRTFDGRDGKVTFQDLDFAGIYPLDHHDLDGPTRVQLGLPLLPGQSATDAKAGKTTGKGGKETPGAASGAPLTPPAQNADQIAANLFG